MQIWMLQKNWIVNHWMKLEQRLLGNWLHSWNFSMILHLTPMNWPLSKRKRGSGQNKQQVARLNLKQTKITPAITHWKSSQLNHNLSQRQILINQEEKKILLAYFAKPKNLARCHLILTVNAKVFVSKNTPEPYIFVFYCVLCIIGPIVDLFSTTLSVRTLKCWFLTSERKFKIFWTSGHKNGSVRNVIEMQF